LTQGSPEQARRGITMETRQIELVRQSWIAVAPRADQVGALFYARLFELDPSLRALFADDIDVQSRKLIALVGHVIVNLENLSSLVPSLQELGRRHVGYGARSAHYDAVGAALVWAVERMAGEAFGPEHRSAWASAYTILAEIMRSAAARYQERLIPSSAARGVDTAAEPAARTVPAARKAALAE
jgi:hemoglobin-like flavoprotein